MNHTTLKPESNYVFRPILKAILSIVKEGMASPESIRTVCVRAATTDGPEFDFHLVELVGQISEYFEEGNMNPDAVTMIREIAQRHLDT